MEPQSQLTILRKTRRLSSKLKHIFEFPESGFYISSHAWQQNDKKSKAKEKKHERLKKVAQIDW